MNTVSHSKCSKCNKTIHIVDLVRDESTDRLVCKDAVRCAANMLKKKQIDNVNAK